MHSPTLDQAADQAAGRSNDRAMERTIDLDAYLRRIRWQGVVAPDLPSLRAIVAAHASTLAFENLDPLLGAPVPLTPEALQRKLVRGGRGGYCFEHNGLLAMALRAIGFRVDALAARVLWNAPVDAVRPRTHMLLRVEPPGGTGEPLIVDVGFGGQTLTGAPQLVADTPQATPHGQVRFSVMMDGDWRLESEVAGEWKPQYRFDLQRQWPVDFEPPNHYCATHPDSHFVNHLVAALALPDRRLALFDTRFSIHHTNGPTEQRTLASAADLQAVLEQDFDLTMPDDPELTPMLRRIVQNDSSPDPHS